MTEFLTPKAIAELTGLNYRSVLREIEDGELAAYKLRGRLRVKVEDYEEWLSRNAVKPLKSAKPYEPPAVDWNRFDREMGILKA
jgi:excisionase family DNA binding protein